MDVNPQAIAEAQFRVVRKGYDPEQVRPLLAQSADSLRSALSRASTAEGRVAAAEARAADADARAIEAEARAKAALQAASVAQESAGEDPEQLRRALLTAQKAADATVAEARTEADATAAKAAEEAKKITTDARAAAARMVADAEQAARAAHAAESERTKSEITELNSRRDQLRADAELLAAHLAAQRERVSGSVDALREVLARPAVLEPLPVPERGDPTGAGVVTRAGAEPDHEPDPAAGGEIVELVVEDDDVVVEADDAGADDPAGDDVAGDLAALTADDPPAPGEPVNDAAEAFFEQGEPFSDERWKRGT